MTLRTTPDHIWQEVRKNLTSEPYNMVEKGEHLRGGVCPSCKDKSLWCKYPTQPGVVYCDHLDKCKYESSTKDLFPELFSAERVIRDNPATPENPNATAQAWMQQVRGFDAGTNGWYTQQQYSYHPAEAKKAKLPAENALAIRFLLPPPMKGGWDRFLDGEHFGKKTYLHYGTDLNGWLWTPPGQVLAAHDTLCVTEGIFDAIALIYAGYKVGALMGAANKPAEFVEKHAHLRLKYIIALDNDSAGQSSAIKLVKWFRTHNETVFCMQPAPSDSKSKIDWNDLHLAGKLTNAAIKDYMHYGELLTAATAERRALLMYQRTGDQFFVFEHRNSTFVWNLDLEKLGKIQQRIRTDQNIDPEEQLSDEQQEAALQESGAVTHLANVGLDFLYTQRNPITDELFYFFRVRHSDGRETLNTLTGAQLSTAADFRKRLLSMASGGLIRADQAAHNWLMSRWMGNIKDVDVVGFAGYSDKHKAWIYPDFAVAKGKMMAKNTEDYIELTKSTRVKSAYHGIDIKVNPNMADYNDDWFIDLYTAWGSKGVISLAFFTLSLFAQQVREVNKSMTFLELVGDPGTGKTTLIEFIWRLFGRDAFEGFDPSSANPAFVARALNQVSNLPVVMIEGDRGQRQGSHRGRFEWAETKKLYNGRSMKGRGMRTQGNETYEPPFLGALVISQNAPVDAEQAVLERIVHCYFHKHDTNTATLRAVKQLVSRTTHDLSGYLLNCLTKSDVLFDCWKEWQGKYEEIYRNNEAQKTYRLALNHSQIAAALHMLKLVTPMSDSTLNTCLRDVQAMSLAREKAIALEHPDVEQFFELLEYLTERGLNINHAGAGQGWAVNLNEIYEKAAKVNQSLQQPAILKPLLRASRRWKATDAMHSKLRGQTIRCWMFDA